MSTICGLINQGKQENCIRDFRSMLDYLSKYPNSRTFQSESRNLCLGNTIQPVIRQDQIEKLPRYGSNNDLLLVADALIDNREQLYHELKLSDRPLEEITNSELILEAFIRWEREAPKHLIGDFAFAIWNVRKEELFLCRDHVGKRTLYYSLEDGRIAFSTLIKPLLLTRNKISYSEQWIANFLAVPEVLNELDLELTLYEGIKQLPPATYMMISKDKIEKKRYWNPRDVKPLRLAGDEAYEEAFRKVFTEAVECRLNVEGEIGIMLSGGLDSGSVASIAAGILAKKAKDLKAYSAIPKADYVDWLPKGTIADESRYIEELARHYPNIALTYCASEDLDPYKQLDRLSLIHEYPYKYSSNLFWIDRIAQLAREDGCKVLLDGQSGNLTISYGSLPEHILTLIHKGKFYRAYKDIMEYARLHNRIPGSVIKHFLRLYVPQPVRNRLGKEKAAEARAIDHLVNRELADKWKLHRKLKRYGLGKYYKRRQTVSDARRMISDNLLFSQAGAMEARLSIEYGVVRRDPTRDKRVIEFCMALPEDQFVRKGMERSLIRRAMKGILPDLIRMNMRERGRQSADWIQRLHQDWKNIREEFLLAIDENSIKSLADTDALKAMISKMSDLPMDEEYCEVQAIMTIIGLSRFLKRIAPNNIIMT